MKKSAFAAVMIGLFSVFSLGQDISDVVVPRGEFVRLYDDPAAIVHTEEFQIGKPKDKFAVSVLVGWRDDRPKRAFASRVNGFLFDFDRVVELESDLAGFMAGIDAASRNPNFSSMIFNTRDGLTVNYYRGQDKRKDERWLFIDFGGYRTYSRDTRHLREILTKLTSARLKMTELGAR